MLCSAHAHEHRLFDFVEQGEIRRTAPHAKPSKYSNARRLLLNLLSEQSRSRHRRLVDEAPNADGECGSMMWRFAQNAHALKRLLAAIKSCVRALDQ